MLRVVFRRFAPLAGAGRGQGTLHSTQTPTRIHPHSPYPPMHPPTHPLTSPQVKGLFDSPLWVDLEPLEPGILPLEEQTQQARDRTPHHIELD